MNKHRRFHVLPVLPLLLGPLVLFASAWLMGRALFWGTPGLQFLPWWAWAWETLRGGHLPLWNPLVGMGAPLIANYQSGMFYPPNWGFFALAALGGVTWMAWGQAIWVTLHLSWAGLGMSRLARHLGLGSLAQTVSGLAFGLSGYLVARAGFFSIIATAAWLPWVLFCVERVALQSNRGMRQGGKDMPSGKDMPRFSRPRFSHFMQLVIVIGMQLLAGHAQTAWYTLLLAYLWAAAWGWFQTTSAPNHSRWSSSRQGSTYGKEYQSMLDRLRDLARSAGRRLVRLVQAFWQRVGLIWFKLTIAVIVGVSLAAVQLLPTAEYLQQSQRANAVEFTDAMTYSFWPWRIIGLVAPNFFGSPATGDFWGYASYWEDAVYIGLLPFLMALRAILRQQKTRTEKRMIYFGLAVTLAAFLLALGQNTPLFPWLYQHVPTFAMFKSPVRWLIWGVFALSLLAGMGLEGWRPPQKRGLYWIRLGTAGAFAVTLGAGLVWFYLRDLGSLERLSTMVRATALAGIWACGTGVLALLYPKRLGQTSEINIRLWRLSVVLWVLMDLWLANWGLNPTVSLNFYQPMKSATSVQERLYLPKNDEYRLKFQRFMRFEDFSPLEDWSRLRAVMLPNLNLMEGMASVNNFDPLIPGRYAHWMEALDTQNAATQERMLALMGVGIVERVDTATLLGVRFDSMKGNYRFNWFGCARAAENGEEAWNMTLAPGNGLILEGVEASQISNCLPSTGKITPLTEDNPNRVVVQVEATTPGWLYAADVWYPGWTALVDGNRQPVLRADYLFRAVPVPAGKHEIVFIYQPFSFTFGGIVSLLAWMTCLTVVMFQRRIPDRRST